MQIITSEKLFDKYPGHKNEIMVLMTAITPNINVLPINDYGMIKMKANSINDSILIIGNDDVLMFGRLPNSASDPDQEVLSDQAYACKVDNHYLIPDTVVSRIPDEMGQNVTFDYLQKVLTNQAKWLTTKGTNGDWFSLVNIAWSGIGNYMKNTFNMNNITISPPSNPNTITVIDTEKRLSYINLHGSQSTPYYYSNIGNSYPIALSPTSGDFNGCLALTESCYGGYCIDRTRLQSIPLQALYDNAIAFVCSNSICYGPAGPPSQAADLLSECFFKRIISGNTTIGQAFLNAKIDFGTQSIKKFGSLNGSARKTLMQFNLYGLCDIRI